MMNCVIKIRNYIFYTLAEMSSVKKPHQYTTADEIELISSYFNVSKACATYMYYRRRRGFPYKEPNDPRFIEWSMQCQNMFVRLDKEDINWDELEYKKDIQQISDMGIEFDVPKNKHITNERENTADGWSVYISDATIKLQKQKLKKMGFIERHRTNKY